MQDDAIARTSLLIAAAALVERAESGCETLDAQIAEQALRGAGRAGRWLHWLASHASGRAALRFTEAAMLPGLSRHYRWRKQRIAQWVDAEQQRGATQLLVLGAGFDALACRFAHARPECLAIEVDRHAPSALKRQIAADIGACLPNLHHIAADLGTESIGSALARCPGFDRTRDSVIVAEGLLMYLEPWRVARLMQALGEQLQSKATLVGTAMTRHADGRVGFERESRWVGWWLRRRGEPFLWGVHAPRLFATLQAMHLQLDEIAHAKDPANPDPAPGEWLFRARLARRTVRGEFPEAAVSDGRVPPCGTGSPASDLPDSLGIASMHEETPA